MRRHLRGLQAQICVDFLRFEGSTTVVLSRAASASRFTAGAGNATGTRSAPRSAACKLVKPYAVARCCSRPPARRTLTTLETPGSCMVTP